MTRIGVDGATIIRVFRCECGKMHCCAGVGMASECSCGRLLYPQVWSKGR